MTLKHKKYTKLSSNVGNTVENKFSSVPYHMKLLYIKFFKLDRDINRKIKSCFRNTYIYFCTTKYINTSCTTKYLKYIHRYKFITFIALTPVSV